MNNRIITQPQIDELRKEINSGGEKNVELASITPFKEDSLWYLKLVYKYENKMGKHTVVIPKASLPFPQYTLPNIDGRGPYYTNHYMVCSDMVTLYSSTCDIAIERGVTEKSCYFDIVTEYSTREMTLDEIEKELGYKVKIINKKEKNNA